MARNKKVKSEYLILIIAWLFWGISQALLWYEEAHRKHILQIISTVPIQTLTCIIINLIIIQCMITVRKKIVGIQRQFGWFAIIIIVFSLICVLSNVSFFSYMNGSDKILRPLSVYLIYGTEKIIFFTGYSTMFFLIRNLKEFQKQKTIAEEAQQAVRDAQLQMLQQQLSPHFLFNTLNSLRSLITIDTSRARNMVTDLSEFLRITLSSYKSIHNTIADEVSLLEYFLKLQKIRFEDDLEYNIDINPELLQFTIPKYILQPLVENAVKYGMQTSPMPLKINISVIRGNDLIKIDVVNTGKLVTSNNGNHCNNGLSNTRTRLNLMFPEKSELILIEKDGRVHAEISINLK